MRVQRMLQQFCPSVCYARWAVSKPFSRPSHKCRSTHIDYFSFMVLRVFT